MSTTFGQWAKSLDDFVLDCRDLRHNWVAEQETYNAGGGRIVRVLECDRCGCMKYQLLKDNKVVSTSMKWLDGYLKPKDIEPGRLPREIVLGESVRRSTVVKTGFPDDVAGFLERRGLKVP